jgi:hypothetical protein
MLSLPTIAQRHPKKVWVSGPLDTLSCDPETGMVKVNTAIDEMMPWYITGKQAGTGGRGGAEHLAHFLKNGGSTCNVSNVKPNAKILLSGTTQFAWENPANDDSLYMVVPACDVDASRKGDQGLAQHWAAPNSKGTSVWPANRRLQFVLDASNFEPRLLPLITSCWAQQLGQPHLSTLLKVMQQALPE